MPSKNVVSLSIWLGIVTAILALVIFLTGKSYLKDFLNENGEQKKIEQKNENSVPPQGENLNSSTPSSKKYNSESPELTTTKNYTQEKNIGKDKQFESQGNQTRNENEKNIENQNNSPVIDNSNKATDSKVINETPKLECETNKTGNYCFSNSSNHQLIIFFCNSSIECEPLNMGHSGGVDAASYIILKPQSTKCFNNLSTSKTFNYKVYIKSENKSSDYDLRYSCYNSSVFDQGQANVEKCQSVTYELK